MNETEKILQEFQQQFGNDFAIHSLLFSTRSEADQFMKRLSSTLTSPIGPGVAGMAFQWLDFADKKAMIFVAGKLSSEQNYHVRKLGLAKADKIVSGAYGNGDAQRAWASAEKLLRDESLEEQHKIRMIEQNINLSDLEGRLKRGETGVFKITRCTIAEQDKISSLLAAYPNSKLKLEFVEGYLTVGFDENFGRGVQYLQSGQVDRAIDSFKRALEYHPDNVPALTNLGTALAGSEQYAEAITHLRRAVQLSGVTEVKPRLQLGMTLLEAGLAGEARTHLEFVRQHTQENSEMGQLARKYLAKSPAPSRRSEKDQRKWWQFWR